MPLSKEWWRRTKLWTSGTQWPKKLWWDLCTQSEEWKNSRTASLRYKSKVVKFFVAAKSFLDQGTTLNLLLLRSTTMPQSSRKRYLHQSSRYSSSRLLKMQSSTTTKFLRVFPLLCSPRTCKISSSGLVLLAVTVVLWTVTLALQVQKSVVRSVERKKRVVAEKVAVTPGSSICGGLPALSTTQTHCPSPRV